MYERYLKPGSETHFRLIIELSETGEPIGTIGFYNYNYFNAYHSYLKGFKILPTNMPRFWGVWLEK